MVLASAKNSIIGVSLIRSAYIHPKMLGEEGKVNIFTENIYPWGTEMRHFGSERCVPNLCSVQNGAQFILYNEVKTDINVLRDRDNDS